MVYTEPGTSYNITFSGIKKISHSFNKPPLLKKIKKQKPEMITVLGNLIHYRHTFKKFLETSPVNFLPTWFVKMETVSKCPNIFFIEI